MAAQLTCPHCQSSLKTNKAMPGGLEVKCPKCKSAFKVPAGGIKPAQVAAAVGAARTTPPAGSSGRGSPAGNGAADHSSKAEPLRRAERSAKNDNDADVSPSKMPMVAIIGGGVLVLAIAVGVGVWVYSGDPTPVHKKNPDN